MQRYNTILGRLGSNASIPVVLKLIYSQGVQQLLYGISATNLCKSDLLSFCHAYNSMYGKLFKTFDKKTILSCQYYCGYLCFDLLFDLQRYMFLSKLVSTGLLDDRRELDRLDYRDLLTLKSKYNLIINDSKFRIKQKFWDYFMNLINIV